MTKPKPNRLQTKAKGRLACQSNGSRFFLSFSLFIFEIPSQRNWDAFARRAVAGDVWHDGKRVGEEKDSSKSTTRSTHSNHTRMTRARLGRKPIKIVEPPP